MKPEDVSEETWANVMYSVSFLENLKLVEKCGRDKNDEPEFCLTDNAEQALPKLVESHNGNRSLACLEMILGCALGKDNAIAEEALGVHTAVLHLIAYGEPMSKEDVNWEGKETECDGFCQICRDYTCPAKDEDE